MATGDGIKVCGECGNVNGTPHEARCSQATDPLARVIRTLHAAADDPDLTEADLAALVLVTRDGIRELRVALERLVDAQTDTVSAQGDATRFAQRVLDATRDLAPKRGA